MQVALRLSALFVLVFAATQVSGQNSRLSGSLASGLLINKTQTQILRHDDQVDTACLERRFADVVLVGQPAVADAGKVVERKWQEQWTLDRCGREVGYRVFFTDLGDGGAHFAFKLTN